MARVQEPGPIRQILEGQEDLGDFEGLFLKGLFIGPHEPALTDGCGRLLHRQALGILAQPKLLDSADDSAGGDHDNLPAVAFQCR